MTEPEPWMGGLDVMHSHPKKCEHECTGPHPVGESMHAPAYECPGPQRRTTDNHSDLTFVAGLGHATSCAVPIRHRPTPQRYVWHHVLPQACGGKTEPANLVSVCDSCHYSVHRWLWMLAQAAKMPRGVNAEQLQLASAGFAAAQAAGTVGRIPDEGGGVAS